MPLPPMTPQAWTALTIVGVTFIGLASNRFSADLLLLGALAGMILLGVVSPEQALAGFSNTALFTVALLLVIAQAIRQHGALRFVRGWMLAEGGSLFAKQGRLMGSVALLSAFLNNTTIVALLLPEVQAWAKRVKIPLSKVLIPLTYATTLGGLCTTVGTTTHLVANGLLVKAGLPEFGVFEITLLGLPLAVAGIVLVLLASPFLLPTRRSPDEDFSDLSSFTTELSVIRGGPLEGVNLGRISHAGSKGLFPVEVLRGQAIIHAPQGHFVLQGGDRLIMSGSASALIGMKNIPGLQAMDDQVFAEGESKKRHLVEVVVSEKCPLVDQLVGRGAFRNRYSAAVVAVSRRGTKGVGAPEGGWVLKSGDTLLLDAREGFFAQHADSQDFYFVSRREEAVQAAATRGGLVMSILLSIVVLAATGWMSLFQAALLGMLALLSTRILKWREAMKQVDLRMLLTLGASIGIGSSLEHTGAARAIAGGMVALGSGDPHWMLAALYVSTMLLTEVVTNNAAVVIMFPFAVELATSLGLSPIPFVAALMMAASSCFATPTGYQTNLMVYGPGGYKFSDFMRIGIVLDLTLAALAITLTPMIWPFQAAAG